jgi:hypothetical protein
MRVHSAVPLPRAVSEPSGLRSEKRERKTERKTGEKRDRRISLESLQNASVRFSHNTGSGLKYPEAYSTRFPRTAAGEHDKLGGLITPR